MVRFQKATSFRAGRLMLALMCLTFMVLPALAQFETRAFTSLPNNEFALTTGDFNGDGKLDIAVIGNELMILLGNGDGTFQKPIEYFVSGYSIAAADFNGDGILDLVVSNIGSSVSVVLGNGDGTFQDPIVTSTSNFATFLAVGDFNNDGKPDVVVIDSPYVSVLLGNGDGSFRVASDNSSFAGAHQLVVGDFNNDHNLDVLADGYSFTFVGLGLLLGNGDGTLQPSLNTTLNLPTANPATVGDFNQDGNLDFATTQSAMAVFLGNGDGTFKPEVDYPIPGGALAAEAADFNGDGKLDLICQSGFKGTDAPRGGIDEFLGNGDGTFEPRRFYNQQIGGFPVIGDFNGDGKPDLGFLGSFAVVTMLNTGTARFFPSTPIQFPKILVNTESPTESVTLVNIGKKPLTFNSFSVSGDFTASNSCGASLASGAKCTIQAKFNPQSADYLGGTIMISDSASSQPQFILLKGAATAVHLSPSALNFGNQKVGTTSPAQVVTVTNVSDTAVDFGSFSIGGPDLKDFSIDSQTCGTQVAPGASCTATVIFNPKKTGSRTARINVDLSGSPDPPTRIHLSGTGT